MRSVLLPIGTVSKRCESATPGHDGRLRIEYSSPCDNWRSTGSRATEARAHVAKANAQVTKQRDPERLSAWILAGIAAIEGLWVILNFAQNPAGFMRYIGFAPGRRSRGMAVGGHRYRSVRLAERTPAERPRKSRSSFVSEIPRSGGSSYSGDPRRSHISQVGMDHLGDQGIGPLLQTLASGLAFGLAHGVWGSMARSLRTVAGATVITGVLGATLGLVYIIAGRSVAPCIAAHFLINALIEPGLVLAATRGEMGRAGRAR
jgi:hypothetical protein